MIDDMKLAQQLKELISSKASSSSTSSVQNVSMSTGIATTNSADSEDGKTVFVERDAVVISEDDAQAVEMPTTVEVKAGDIVQITTVGAANSTRTSTVTGVIGRGQEQANEVTEAVDTAETAVTTAKDAAATAQHFWADDSGAHVSSTGDHDTSGFHQLMTSVKNAFMHGNTELMTISENLIELGKNSTSAVIEFCGKLAQISAKKWTWLEETRTGIDMHSAYGTSISCDTTNTSIGASVEATQLAPDGSTGGAVNLNGEWLGLYGHGMFSAYQIEMKDVANALDAYFTVRRSAGVITSYGRTAAHYTKIGIWSVTNNSDILKIRVMTGNGYNGEAHQNSEIDIFIKRSNTTSGTTGAFGVTYELHNASSDVLSAYVVATAYNSCDIWIKNSLGWENGWYVAEYDGGTWSDGGSLHQTSIPSGTLQNTACITAIQPVVVLYNGGAALRYDVAPGAGTTGTVTLSESAANFSKLKIFFRTDDNAYGSYEVPFPNGKRVGLSANWSTGVSMWYKARSIDISGTSITTVEYGNVNSDGSSFSHTNVIYIVRVEGIR